MRFAKSHLRGKQIIQEGIFLKIFAHYSIFVLVNENRAFKLPAYFYTKIEIQTEPQSDYANL